MPLTGTHAAGDSGHVSDHNLIDAALAALQPLDSDLTAIAALTTTVYGRAFLALADAAAGRTALGLGTAALSASGDFQPSDSDLTAIAALTTTSYGRAFLALADAAAGRTALGLGTAALSASGDFQPIDSDLTSIAALTTTAYGRAFLALADAAAGRTALGLTAPEFIMPPGSFIAIASSTVWYGANAATFLRFNVPVAKAYRWAHFRVGTQSGNIQCGVVSLARSGTTITGTRVMDSGVIACPAAGGARVDMGATTLTPGDYALFLWCDNTTAAFHHSSDNSVINSRILMSATGLAGGVPVGPTTLSATSRWVTGLQIESDS